MKVLYALILLLLIFSLQGCNQPSKKHYTDGLTAFNKEDYDGAIKEFRKAVELNPNYTDAWYFLGLSKFMKDDFTAWAEFTRTIELDEKRHDAWAYRGMLFFMMDSFKQALPDLNKAIRLKPDYSEAWFYRGNTKLGLNDYEGAILDLDRAEELKPGYEAAIYTRGMAQLGKEDYKRAIKDFDKTIDAKSKYAVKAYYFRGISYAYLEELDKACSDFRQSFELGYKEAATEIEQYCK